MPPRLSRETVRRLCREAGEPLPEPERSKYGAVPTAYNGVRYASKAEARRAAELDEWVTLGGVLWWIGQPTFRLGVPENVYRPDFLVVSDVATWVEEVKGHETAKFKRDKKLWRAYGPCLLYVLRGGKREVIVGGKMPRFSGTPHEV